MANDIRRYAPKDCAKCLRPFTPSGPRQLYCDKPDCDAVMAEVDRAAVDRASAETPGHGRIVAASEAKPDPEREAEAKEIDEADELTALDVIDAFGLDYNLGNVARFVLERTDGDELQNIREAQVYLERAIARLEKQGA
jgi:hypothetical protein